jgi:hypothetical protein
MQTPTRMAGAITIVDTPMDIIPPRVGVDTVLSIDQARIRGISERDIHRIVSHHAPSLCVPPPRFKRSLRCTPLITLNRSSAGPPPPGGCSTTTKRRSTTTGHRTSHGAFSPWRSRSVRGSGTEASTWGLRPELSRKRFRLQALGSVVDGLCEERRHG